VGETFLAAEPPRLAGPTLARAHIERAATWVAGAAIDATRRILSGEFRKVFIPIAGFHHAHAQEARLYCLYNDPALAIHHALAHVEGNVAYIDIDIHQGDGVYDAFADEPRVFIADLHEDWSTLFPYTPDEPGEGDFSGRRAASGRGSAVGTKRNIALKPQTTDTQYLAHWEEAEAFVRAANPEFIVFESGVDGLENDPLSNQRLSTRAIYEVTRRVCALADECASGRLLVLGGGGYEVEGASKGWAAVVRALLDRPMMS
jgi:acetoin utilization protein AcuC